MSVTAYLTVSDGNAAVEFYKKAFSASERMRMAADGKKLMHAELEFAGGKIMLSDDIGGHGQTPEKLGGSPVTIHVQLDWSAEVDPFVAKAKAAGAKVTMGPMDAMWGHRYAQFTDPFGHHWGVGGEIKKN